MAITTRTAFRATRLPTGRGCRFCVAGMLVLGMCIWAGDGHGGDDPGRLDLGARPAGLVADMAPGPLRNRLAACAGDNARRSDFSIGHRGAPLGYPEHTRESYVAAARQGAGLLECDVTFTRDLALVCRHAQCDLHSTTDILETPLAEKCDTPFTPARFDAGGRLIEAAQARCCTSDITLAEFRTLRGRHDVVDGRASTPGEYLAVPKRSVPGADSGTLMSHRASIALFRELGVAMTPELKTPEVEMPFAGLTDKDYARAMIEEYRSAGVGADDVYPQSFRLDDILLWLREYPEFGDNAVYLDGRYDLEGFDAGVAASWQPGMGELRALGVNTIAPPLWVLLALRDGTIVPSPYARAAREAGLDIVTWTLERSGSLSRGGGWYYRSVADAIGHDGDVFEVLHVLAEQVGVRAVFSDWPATVTYYANCLDID